MLLQQRKRVRYIGGLYKRLARRLLQRGKRQLYGLFQRVGLHIYGLRRGNKFLRVIGTYGYVPQRF